MTSPAAKYRERLPQLEAPVLTDGGLETTLIFHQGMELPDFASFVLLETEEGRRALKEYFTPYAEIARRRGLGLMLESATWRANPDWGRKLGYSDARLAELNRAAIDLLLEVRAAHEAPRSPMIVSGCVGPRGDGYVPSALMSAEEAQRYHTPQIETFAGSAADMVSALTMNYLDEAIGIARAAASAGIPCAISFTAETDGCLPTGQSLREAVERTDDATGGAPAYYMVNCAHPTHVEGGVAEGGDWLERVRGFRSNASAKSHAELNEATELDAGDPIELAQRHRAIFGAVERLAVLGGCCGTDHRHVEQLADAWLGAARACSGLR